MFIYLINFTSAICKVLSKKMWKIQKRDMVPTHCRVYNLLRTDMLVPEEYKGTNWGRHRSKTWLAEGLGVGKSALSTQGGVSVL